jgi:glycosyltransferase involved in cell wall biosynthesis
VWTLREPPELIITCAKFLIEGVRSALPRHLQESQRIEAVPNAVDLSKFTAGDKHEAKREVGASLDRPLLLMMANLAPHKGQETAIRAVGQLAARGVKTDLWLAGADRSGDGNYEARLKNMIAERGLGERVTLLGFRQDGVKLLQAADIVLLPSTSEGLPLTLLEAQACGVPVVAAPTAGIPEIVSQERTGFLVAADDDAGYAARIELLLREPHTYHAIATAAAARCRADHNWETYHSRISELYTEVKAG